MLPLRLKAMPAKRMVWVYLLPALFLEERHRIRVGVLWNTFQQSVPAKGPTFLLVAACQQLVHQLHMRNGQDGESDKKDQQLIIVIKE